jgi:hypothetical protein
LKTIQIPGSRGPRECVELGDTLQLQFLEAGTFTPISGGTLFNPPICQMDVNAGDCIGPWTAPKTPSTLSWQFTLSTGGSPVSDDIDVKKDCRPNNVKPC